MSWASGLDRSRKKLRNADVFFHWKVSLVAFLGLAHLCVVRSVLYLVKLGEGLQGLLRVRWLFLKLQQDVRCHCVCQFLFA
jgi:hypothetical protein